MYREEFRLVESQMVEQLAIIRNRYHQAGDKGSMVEQVLREFLRRYLPRSFEVGHGEVIDAGGNRSTQTDVVITCNDHPPIFTPDLPGLFLIEGVMAAGEVKTVLTKEELEKTVENSRRFKSLTSSHRNTMEVASEHDLHRFSDHRPYFIFAFETRMPAAKIGEYLIALCHSGDQIVTSLVDAVFILGEHPLINYGDGLGRLRFRNPDGQLRAGWVWQQSSSSLLALMLWLAAVMPRERRFEPIILPYLQNEAS